MTRMIRCWTAGGILYLALFPSITTYIRWNCAAPRIGHNVAGMFSNVTVVLGTAASIALLGEEARRYHPAALVLACLAVHFASEQHR